METQGVINHTVRLLGRRARWMRRRSSSTPADAEVIPLKDLVNHITFNGEKLTPIIRARQGRQTPGRGKSSPASGPRSRRPLFGSGIWRAGCWRCPGGERILLAVEFAEQKMFQGLSGLRGHGLRACPVLSKAQTVRQSLRRPAETDFRLPQVLFRHDGRGSGGSILRT